MENKNKKTQGWSETLRAAYPEATIRHGWHLAGPGPARFGWAAIYPSGCVRYLGPTIASALGYARISGGAQ